MILCRNSWIDHTNIRTDGGHTILTWAVMLLLSAHSLTGQSCTGITALTTMETVTRSAAPALSDDILSVSATPAPYGIAGLTTSSILLTHVGSLQHAGWLTGRTGGGWTDLAANVLVAHPFTDFTTCAMTLQGTLAGARGFPFTAFLGLSVGVRTTLDSAWEYAAMIRDVVMFPRGREPSFITGMGRRMSSAWSLAFDAVVAPGTGIGLSISTRHVVDTTFLVRGELSTRPISIAIAGTLRLTDDLLIGITLRHVELLGIRPSVTVEW